MKTHFFIAPMLIATLLAYLPKTTPTPTTPPPYTKQQIARGKYLVQIMGCRDCHSPKMMTPQGPAVDINRDLSGHPETMPLGKINKDAMSEWVLFNMMNTAAVGPWGASFAANLTSDDTGIGEWKQAQFLVAMREGKSKGIRTARPLLPPMPWQNYVNMKEKDLIAIFAYLKSTKPIKNDVPQPIAPNELK
jgi:hypothetical protein